MPELSENEDSKLYPKDEELKLSKAAANLDSAIKAIREHSNVTELVAFVKSAHDVTEVSSYPKMREALVPIVEQQARLEKHKLDLLVVEAEERIHALDLLAVQDAIKKHSNIKELQTAALKIKNVQDISVVREILKPFFRDVNESLRIGDIDNIEKILNAAMLEKKPSHMSRAPIIQAIATHNDRNQLSDLLLSPTLEGLWAPFEKAMITYCDKAGMSYDPGSEFLKTISSEIKAAIELRIHAIDLDAAQKTIQKESSRSRLTDVIDELKEQRKISDISAIPLISDEEKHPPIATPGYHPYVAKDLDSDRDILITTALDRRLFTYPKRSGYEDADHKLNPEEMLQLSKAAANLDSAIKAIREHSNVTELVAFVKSAHDVTEVSSYPKMREALAPIVEQQARLEKHKLDLLVVEAEERIHALDLLAVQDAIKKYSNIKELQTAALKIKNVQDISVVREILKPFFRDVNESLRIGDIDNIEKILNAAMLEKKPSHMSRAPIIQAIATHNDRNQLSDLLLSPTLEGLWAPFEKAMITYCDKAGMSYDPGSEFLKTISSEIKAAIELRIHAIDLDAAQKTIQKESSRSRLTDVIDELKEQRKISDISAIPLISDEEKHPPIATPGYHPYVAKDLDSDHDILITTALNRVTAIDLVAAEVDALDREKLNNLIDSLNLINTDKDDLLLVLANEKLSSMTLTKESDESLTIAATPDDKTPIRTDDEKNRIELHNRMNEIKANFAPGKSTGGFFGKGISIKKNQMILITEILQQDTNTNQQDLAVSVATVLMSKNIDISKEKGKVYDLLHDILKKANIDEKLIVNKSWKPSI